MLPKPVRFPTHRAIIFIVDVFLEHHNDHMHDSLNLVQIQTIDHVPRFRIQFHANQPNAQFSF
jgi:hypothetical protein